MTTTLKASTARVRAGNRSIREYDVEVEVERTPRGDLTVDLYFNDPNDGARIVIRSEDVEAFIAAAKGAEQPQPEVDLGPITDPAIHTIGGKPIDDLTNPGEYGRTHDMTCPACVASGSSFTTSPRSETYWSS